MLTSLVYTQHDVRHTTGRISFLPLISIILLHLLFLLALGQGSRHRNEEKTAELRTGLLLPVQMLPAAQPVPQAARHAGHGQINTPVVTPKSPPPADKLAPTAVAVQPRAAPPTNMQAAVNAATNPAADAQLETAGQPTINLSQLRSQATLLSRETAVEEGGSVGNPGMSGDYYGSYSGADSGTFYIHIDRSGNIFGSANSSILHGNLTITGKVSSEGIVQMTGKGLAGAASFDGRIQQKTGAVSGNWNLAKFGRGQFSGQRAKAGGGL